MKVALLRAGITQRALAKKLRLSPPYVSQVIGGTRRSKRVERALSRMLVNHGDRS
jgi:DNA-binding transcriptional regulator YdaS (Cro superfamily)